MGSSLGRAAGYGCAALGAAFFSTKSIFIKLAFQDHLDASLFLAYRMIFAAPVFAAVGVWAYAMRRAKGLPPLAPREIASAVGIGFLGYYVSSVCDVSGLMFISASLERLVLFTYPIFVMLIGVAFYGQRLTAASVIAALVSYVGLAIVFATDLPSGGRDTAIGTALVLGAALSYAWYQILAKHFVISLGSALFTSIALTSASVFCIVHQAILGTGSFAASPRFLWLAFGCAILATVLPTFLLSAGLARVSAQAVAMMGTVSPVVTIGLAVAILGEPFTLADAVGSALVLAGVGLFTFGDNRTRRTPSPPKPDDAALPAGPPPP